MDIQYHSKVSYHPLARRKWRHTLRDSHCARVRDSHSARRNMRRTRHKFFMFLNINPKYKYTVLSLVTMNGKQIYKFADWSIEPQK